MQLAANQASVSTSKVGSEFLLQVLHFLLLVERQERQEGKVKQLEGRTDVRAQGAVEAGNQKHVDGSRLPLRSSD